MITKVPFIDLPEQHRPLRDRLITILAQSLESGRFIGGPAVVDFEAAFAKVAGTAHVVGVSDGTNALTLALRALGVGPGQDVVTVPNTFAATVEAIVKVGGNPIFVDVEPDTSLMDVARLEDLLRGGSRPAVAIPVHLYGQCADMRAIRELANRYGFKVVEDAAQAHEAAQHGRPAGSLGDAAAFSFYPGKNLGALGDAGAITTSDGTMAEMLRQLRDHGQASKNDHRMDGYTARLDALQAAFLLAKLPLLPGWNERRREIASTYDAAFADLPSLRTVAIRPANRVSRHLYVIHHQQRDKIIQILATQGIECGLHYPVPIHLQPCRSDLRYKRGDFPVSETLAAELLSLPMFPEMNEEQISHVIAGVREAVAQFSR